MRSGARGWEGRRRRFEGCDFAKVLFGEVRKACLQGVCETSKPGPGSRERSEAAWRGQAQPHGQGRLYSEASGGVG